jgi:tetratricopeptide (TPR) repeat protein
MASINYLLTKARVWVLLLLNRQEAVVTALSEMLRQRPNDRYGLASRAHALAQLGRRDEAMADYAALTQRSDANAADWFNHGFVLEEAGRIDEALRCFERATSLDAKLDRAWYGLGLCLIRLGRLDEALVALKRNTELQPMSPYGWYQLARVHIDMQRPDEARKVIRHLKGFEPKVAAQLERETGLVAPQG